MGFYALWVLILYCKIYYELCKVWNEQPGLSRAYLKLLHGLMSDCVEMHSWPCVLGSYCTPTFPLGLHATSSLTSGVSSSVHAEVNTVCVTCHFTFHKDKSIAQWWIDTVTGRPTNQNKASKGDEVPEVLKLKQVLEHVENHGWCVTATPETVSPAVSRRACVFRGAPSGCEV